MAGLVWSPVFTDCYTPLEAGSIDRTDTAPHDRAIARAMNATYKPNKQVTGDPKCTLFVGMLDHNTNEETLERIFSYYGDIKKLRIVRDIVTGFSKGYAFVEFEFERQALRAWNGTHKKRVNGKEILVEFEHERKLTGWVPRRFGGGLGGKKESGQLRFGGRERLFIKPITNILKKEVENHDYSTESPRLERDRNRERRPRSRSRSRDQYRRRESDRDRYKYSSRSKKRSRSRSRDKRRRSRSRNKDRRRSRSQSQRRRRRSRSRSRHKRSTSKSRKRSRSPNIKQEIKEET